MLEFEHDLGRHPAHEFDRVLVAEVIGSLDRVVHVPQPAVLPHVSKRGADAALRRDGVRAGGKYFGQHGDLEAGLCQLQRRTHAGTAGTDDHSVELAYRNSHYTLQRICSAQPA